MLMLLALLVVIIGVRAGFIVAIGLGAAVFAGVILHREGHTHGSVEGIRTIQTIPNVKSIAHEHDGEVPDLLFGDLGMQAFIKQGVNVAITILPGFNHTDIVE